jgi:hypothetical protein
LRVVKAEKLESSGRQRDAVADAKHIFFSYSRRDRESVDRVVEALGKAGYDVWIDRRGIVGSRLWRREIVIAIRDSKAFILALSPQSIASVNVRKELDLCDDYRKQVVPLLLAETTIPEEMKYQLAGVQQIDCQDFGKGVEELCRTLDGLHCERRDPSTEESVPEKPDSSSLARSSGFLRSARVRLAAFLLLGAVVLGVAAQYLIRHYLGGPAVIGMTPFEVGGDEELAPRQVELSNELRLKLSAVFSRAGLKVIPGEVFKKDNLADWSYDSWLVTKVGKFEPLLLLRTALSRCVPNGPRSASYFWYAQPYSSKLQPLPDAASASGPDTEVLSLRIAYALLTSTPGATGLNDAQRNAAMKEILDSALFIARRRGMSAEARAATPLVGQPSPDSRKILALLDSFPKAEGACDQEASRNRKAEKDDATSYSGGGP